MRKLLSIILVLMMMGSMLGLFACKPTPPDPGPDTSTVFDENNIVFSFASLSDVHFTSVGDYKYNREKNDKAYNYLLAEAAKLDADGLDAIGVAGDITNTGTSGQVGYLKEALQKLESTSVGKNYFMTTGNHDVWYPESYYRADSEATLENLYKNLGDEYFPDVEKDLTRGGYRHIVLDGVHMIFMEPTDYGYGPDGSNTKNPIFCPFKQGAIDWLDETLEEITTENPNDFVFIYTHPMMYDTVYGSQPENYENEVETSRWTTKSLAPVLEKYPQAVSFSGHSHFPINDDRSVWQGDYTAFGCGSVVSVGTEYGAIKPYNYTPEASSGWLIQLDGNGNMRATRLNFAKEEHYGAPIEISHPMAEKSHLEKYNFENRKEENKAPTLLGELSVQRSEDSLTSAKLTIPAGVDDSFVHHYLVKVEDALTGALISENKYVTDYSVHSNPTETMTTPYECYITVNAEECKVTTYAVDCWGVKSGALTTTIEESNATILPATTDFSALNAGDKIGYGEANGLSVKGPGIQYQGGVTLVSTYGTESSCDAEIKQDANGDKYAAFRVAKESKTRALKFRVAESIATGERIKITLVFRLTENFELQSGQTKSIFLRLQTQGGANNNVYSAINNLTPDANGWMTYEFEMTTTADTTAFLFYTYAAQGHGFDVKSFTVQKAN